MVPVDAASAATSNTAEDPCVQHVYVRTATPQDLNADWVTPLSSPAGRIRSLDEIVEEIAYMQTVDENAGLTVPTAPWICVPPGHRKPLLPWTERLAAQEHAAAVRDAAGLARPGPASAPASSAAGTQRVAIRISGDRLSAQRWCEPPISAADLGSSVGSSKPDLGSSVESGATAGSWVQVPAVEGGVSDGPLPDVR